MIVIRILLNAVIMAMEIAVVAAIAALGYLHPFLFAALTAALSFGLGLNLEAARLRNELPFYFVRTKELRLVLVPFVAFLEALMKGILAGIAALFTFSGTEAGRLFWVSIIFGMTVYLGAGLVRSLSLSLDAHPARWAFFRLGPPLGLVFSVGITVAGALGLIAHTSVGEIGWKLVWELPEKPSISQVSELFFQLKQAFDDFIVTLLSTGLGREWARAVGTIISVNVLTGFVASVYAAMVASFVRGLERRLP